MPESCPAEKAMTAPLPSKYVEKARELGLGICRCWKVGMCDQHAAIARALKAAEARGIERAAEIVYGVLVHDETPDDAELALKDAIRRIRALLTPTEDGGAGK